MNTTRTVPAHSPPLMRPALGGVEEELADGGVERVVVPETFVAFLQQLLRRATPAQEAALLDLFGGASAPAD